MFSVIVALATVSLLSGCVPDPAPGPRPIGMHERFSGRVNGQGDGAIIQTACGGPIWPGRTGAVVSGQTVSVVADPAGDGDTGTSSVVYAQPGPNYNMIEVTAYDTSVEIPAGVEAPCDGKGVVTFHQCWGIVACTSGAPATVNVRFVNIAY